MTASAGPFTRQDGSKYIIFNDIFGSLQISCIFAVPKPKATSCIGQGGRKTL